MQFGVVYPQTEFGSDPAAIKDYAQAAEVLGYRHILTYDHVLGANPNRPGGLNGPYTHESAFMEPFVLFSYLAGVTQTIEFTTGILILPQRQAALAAKQAATLDVLSGGRLRLGVGLGWNPVEYEALNESFRNRGRRIEEQIILMKKLWAQPLVTFEGHWHKVSDAGLNPLPLKRSIPIWFGGHADAVLERTARLGDGWMPGYRAPDDAAPAIDRLRSLLEQAGRAREPFGIEIRLHYGDGNPDTWRNLVHDWRSLGATHISINTMGFNFSSPQAHIEAIQKFSEDLSICDE